jgi:hypothetical protein
MRKLTTRGQPSCPSPYTFDALRGMGSRVAAGPWVVAGGVSSPGSLLHGKAPACSCS